MLSKMSIARTLPPSPRNHDPEEIIISTGNVNVTNAKQRPLS